MNRVVILTLDGDLDRGIRVTLAWGTTDKSAEGKIMSRLAPNPEIYQLYTDWQKGYRNLEYFYRNPRLTPKGLYISSMKSCEQLVDELSNNINQWLNSRSDGFDQIRNQLTTELSRHRDIRVLIQTDNPQLQRLPWHLWDVWENNHDSVEFSLIPLEYQPTPETKLRNRVRLLAILGNSDGIDIETDHNNWQQVSSLDSSSCFLVEPTREELDHKLWEKEGWDILFFAGHSSSECNDESGRIYINQEDSLIIDDLIPALKEAIKNGLKLAIFNSCDGLGLANALARLQMPQAIIMKEPVPDEVAQTFLRFFLEEFSQGKSLHKAVKVARKRLHYLENRLDKKLPYATWLPVIYHHPKAQPWRWPVSGSLVTLLIKLALGTVALLSIYGIYKIATEPNKLGDKISSGEEILDTTSARRFKHRGVKFMAKCQTPWRDNLAIFSQKTWQRWERCWWTKSNYKKAGNLFLKSWQEEDKDPETLIYLNNALLEATKSDYYTIAVAVPIVRNKNGSVKHRELAQKILRGIGHAQTEVNLELFQDNDKLPNNFTEKLLGKDVINGKSIKGKGLKVLIADDANITSEAIQRAKALVKERDILGVVGHYASDMTMETVDIYNSNKLVLISSGSTTEELTEHPRNFFFRTVPTAKIAAQYLVDYLVENGHQKAAVFYNPRSPFTHSFWQEFKQQFTNQGGELVDIKHYDISKPNFNPKQAIEEIGKTQDTAIVLNPDGQVTNAVTNAIDMIKENNGRNVMVGSSGIARSKTLALKQPDLFENLVVSVSWHHLNSANPQVNQDAQTLWGKSFNSLTAWSALAYDATRVLITAIEKQKNPTRLGMQKTLKSPDFSADGVTGKIEFEPANGNRKNPSQILVHVVPCPNQESGLEFVPLEYSSCDQKH
ncbi:MULTISPECIES: ABC transporter substrate-binding protein [Moorena]|uniref:ABC-type branched-chain amino acid transport system, periplasmic component n=1 Tax=Moorena producens 3L TaxID=489825 RepID=F4XLS7_9CYAN|nr:MULTISPECIES: ABC transporter substrate-binding protein [Moorena]EGJ34422.1 ABC-type branched-chain amino acid transport system, periplasmic component [Moorena producens 3L]NEP30166.1 ABC transporter substrate-binding protein [Moorena sp. SIO3B2]NEP64191.1 ABC transporter substrate-binding protein [Moorena sp. SIO3A5]NER88074.1 ABC transporter substrate-binding protein [Moorena sp. SIO3A2]NES42984.1 ABC transporter substrate-binding protein [Moorena sp. SIO2C4]